jgi:hypothetical protein
MSGPAPHPGRPRRAPGRPDPGAPPGPPRFTAGPRAASPAPAPPPGQPGPRGPCPHSWPRGSSPPAPAPHPADQPGRGRIPAHERPGLTASAAHGRRRPRRPTRAAPLDGRPASGASTTANLVHAGPTRTAGRAAARVAPPAPRPGRPA